MGLSDLHLFDALESILLQAADFRLAGWLAVGHLNIWGQAVQEE
jgi:hypothetical protein